MSEVKRYTESCGEGGGVVEHRNGELVSIKDFDRVTAERDAALALIKTHEDAMAHVLERENVLQQRLTAADERNDEAIDLLRRARAVIEGGGWADLERDIAKFLKPAECCTVSAEDQALLDAGDYTPEELFGIGGKPSCPKCAP